MSRKQVATDLSAPSHQAHYNAERDNGAARVAVYLCPLQIKAIGWGGLPTGDT